MGTRGLGAATGLTLGSVAYQVVPSLAFARYAGEVSATDPSASELEGP